MRLAGLCFLILTAELDGQTPPSNRLRGQPPVPIWTGSGETGPSSTKQNVFLSEDGHHLIVIVPRENGGKTVERYPLWNDVFPTAVQIMRPLGTGRWAYEYAIGNSSSATVPIGKWTVLLPPSSAAAERILSPHGQKLWGGAASPAVIFRQELLDSDELGRRLLWFHHQEGSQVLPGETVTGFGIESSLLPGFTTAWFGAGKLAKVDESWPDRIIEQLGPLYRDEKWMGSGLLMIGPMFPPGTPAPSIQSNFRSGLKHLIEDGRLSDKSAFTIELLGALAEPDPGRLKGRTLSALPKGHLENAILAAVEVSLGITRGPR